MYSYDGTIEKTCFSPIQVSKLEPNTNNRKTINLLLITNAMAPPSYLSNDWTFSQKKKQNSWCCIVFHKNWICRSYCVDTQNVWFYLENRWKAYQCILLLLFICWCHAAYMYYIGLVIVHRIFNNNIRLLLFLLLSVIRFCFFVCKYFPDFRPFQLELTCISLLIIFYHGCRFDLVWISLTFNSMDITTKKDHIML